MGNEQSSSSRDEQKLSQAEVRRLLNEQRKMYEKKCQEVIDQAKAQSAQNAQTVQTQPPQPAYTPQPAYVPQPAYAQQPTHFVHSPNQGQSMPGPNLERQRAPYSYAREDLQQVVQGSAPSAPNLYPNLNNRSNQMASFSFENQNNNPAQDFVFVNHHGPQRSRPSAPARDRSTSRARNNTVNNELLCPTCKCTFGLQIYQCNRGHSSCNNCKEQGRCCGICGNDITTVRNFALEGYMADQRMPCVNEQNGCTLSFKISDMETHNRECPFKDLECPVGCRWRGQLKQLSQHFDASHPEKRSVDVDSEIRLRDISRDSQNVYLIVVGTFNFLFHVRVSARQLYMSVQLIGTKVSASKWSYEVHLYDKSACRRKYTYSDACLSHVEPVADTHRDGKCSVLPYSYASTFLNNDTLTYKIYIKKNTDNRGDFRNNNQRGRGKK